MKYTLATTAEIQSIYSLVQHTIKTIYPKYYPKEVVDFFCEHHSPSAIEKDVESGNVSVLIVGDEIVGTGSFVDNHITRVYVAPKHQGKGYGTFIINAIESAIMERNSGATVKIYLDASLPAAGLYEKLGYKTVKHEKHSVDNGVILAYEVMEKEI